MYELYIHFYTNAFNTSSAIVSVNAREPGILNAHRQFEDLRTNSSVWTVFRFVLHIFRHRIRNRRENVARRISISEEERRNSEKKVYPKEDDIWTLLKKNCAQRHTFSVSSFLWQYNMNMQ